MKLKRLVKKMTNILPDGLFLRMEYFRNFGRFPDLKHPKTYNEKLQWLKLHDRRPEYTRMVDKYEAKLYVAEKIGEEYIIPTLGVWDSFDQIDFDSLPDQFVLKCTHDSGGLVVCRDKSRLDMAAARKRITNSLKRNYYWHGREWPYKNVKPRIIAEQYMEDTQTQELRDYKFFCFDGEVKVMFIVTDRQSAVKGTCLDFFDTQFNHLPIRKGRPNADMLPKKPECFEEMKMLATKLAEGIPHLRVDFYEVDGKAFFGELTFFSGGGIGAFEPEEWDHTFGDWIDLP